MEQVWGWNEGEQRQFHEQRFQAQEFRIIHLAGTEVGTMAVVVAADSVKVNGLFLLPEYQGQGSGRRCMRLVMEEARQLGLPVRLQVLKVNPRARNVPGRASPFDPWRRFTWMTKTCPNTRKAAGPSSLPA